MDKQITVFCACVIRDNKILLTLRDEEEAPDAHLKWEFPGGKVEFTETPEEGIIREVFEETGVTVKINRLLPYVQTNYWNYSWGKQQTLCFFFLCDYLKQETVEKDHHVAKIDWVDLEEVKSLPSLPGTMEIIKVVKQSLFKN